MGRVDLVWNARSVELATTPAAVVLNDYLQPDPKPAALSDFAAKVLDPSEVGAPSRASVAILRRDLPEFALGHVLAAGRFSDDLNEMCEWVRHLDHSYVAVQGPPGTGKTYSGAHMIHRLVNAGQRVGITAMSHLAIDNLLRETLDQSMETSRL